MMATEPIKNENELIERLTSVKQSVTQLGMEYIQSKIPFAMDDLEQLIEPLASIERTIDASVEVLENRSKAEKVRN